MSDETEMAGAGASSEAAGAGASGEGPAAAAAVAAAPAIPEEPAVDRGLALTGGVVSVEGLERRAGMRGHVLDRGRPPLDPLRGVDLSVKKGEILCVIGEEGSGAETLGRVIMGLARPSAGKVRFEGKRIDDMGPRARRPFRARMQMLFRDAARSLSPRLTVAEILSEPLRHLRRDLDRDGMGRRLYEAMTATGCDIDWAGLRPGALSPGERQRVAIARALVTEPDFILADDPVAEEDPSVRAEILNLLAKLRRGEGFGLLMLTRDLSVAGYMADRVAVMYLGRIVELASVDELFDRPRHPYTRRLVEALPSLEGGRFEAAPAPAAPPLPMAAPSGCAFAPRCAFAEDRCRRESPALIASGQTLVACHGIEEGRIAVAPPPAPPPEPEPDYDVDLAAAIGAGLDFGPEPEAPRIRTVTTYDAPVVSDPADALRADAPTATTRVEIGEDEPDFDALDAALRAGDPTRGSS